VVLCPFIIAFALIFSLLCVLFVLFWLFVFAAAFGGRSFLPPLLFPLCGKVVFVCFLGVYPFVSVGFRLVLFRGCFWFFLGWFL